jgi:hypothetical protein
VSLPAYDPEGAPIGPRTNLKTWIDSICLATEPMNIRAGRGGARCGASKQASWAYLFANCCRNRIKVLVSAGPRQVRQVSAAAPSGKNIRTRQPDNRSLDSAARGRQPRKACCTAIHQKAPKNIYRIVFLYNY